MRTNSVSRNSRVAVNGADCSFAVSHVLEIYSVAVAAVAAVVVASVSVTFGSL